MKNVRNNIASIGIALVIAIPVSLYAAGQQKLNATAHADDLKPVARVYQVDLPDWEAEPIEEVPEAVTYFDVPLSEQLQDHIFAECEKHNIAPALVISMIVQESSYDSQAIGDDGCSTGLLQVQEKWHKERMKKLGCTDLLDAYQNVTVAVDYLAELKDINSDLYWVLMCYNGGFRYANENMKTGNYSAYAIEITERAAELERMVE